MLLGSGVETAVERYRVGKNSDLEILYRVSKALAHHHDVSALMDEVLGVLEEELGAVRSTLTLLRPGTDNLVIEASRGLTARERRRGQYRVGEGVTGRVAATREPELIPDVTQEPAFLDRTGSRGGETTAFACVPIVRQAAVLGTLSVDLPSEPRRQLEGELALLRIIANILAEAVATIRSQVEERDALLAENRRLREELGEQYKPSNIVGNCSVMRNVYKQIGQVADSPATVLIRGESGTGKELVARALHYGSRRRDGPFVCVNCAALPENLIESELFGHEKGAFTGASEQRRGRFELADGGTLFLDEIGDISLAVQVRLLRVLQERVFERVGGATSVAVDVRVVAATSQDLEKGMKEGKFREDLYYRLNVFPIHLPPLRERRSDLMLLADHFLAKYNQRYLKDVKRISTPAINMMVAYHWPGNVRELENCIERAVLTSNDDVVHGFNLPPSLQTAKATQTELVSWDAADTPDFTTMVANYERELIVDALKDSKGNCAGAARALRTTQRVLNYRIKKLAIEPRDYR